MYLIFVKNINDIILKENIVYGKVIGEIKYGRI